MPVAVVAAISIVEFVGKFKIWLCYEMLLIVLFADAAIGTYPLKSTM